MKKERGIDEVEISDIGVQIALGVEAGRRHLHKGSRALEIQNYAEAEKDLKMAILFFRDVGDTCDEAGALADLGLVYRDQGMSQEALKCFLSAKAKATERSMTFDASCVY